MPHVISNYSFAPASSITSPTSNYIGRSNDSSSGDSTKVIIVEVGAKTAGVLAVVRQHIVVSVEVTIETGEKFEELGSSTNLLFLEVC